MKISIDKSQFAVSEDLYRFASRYAHNHNVTSRLHKAEVGKNGYVFLTFDGEAHGLSPEDIAEELGCRKAVVGKYGKTWYVCGVKEDENPVAARNGGEKIGILTRFAVVFVEYGDSVDGKGRVLGLFANQDEARVALAEAAKGYWASLHLDYIKIDGDTASVGDTEECGCEYRIQGITFPVYKGELVNKGELGI